MMHRWHKVASASRACMHDYIIAISLELINLCNSSLCIFHSCLHKKVLTSNYLLGTSGQECCLCGL